MIRLCFVLLLFCPSVCLALPMEFFGPDPGEMVPAGDWGTGYAGADADEEDAFCMHPVMDAGSLGVDSFKVPDTEPVCCGGLGYDLWWHDNQITEELVRVRNPSEDGGCESTAGHLPDCNCDEPGPSCGTLVTSDSTIEDPDAIDGGTTTEVNTYDTDNDGIPDCKKSTGGCASGDQICECLAETRAELVAIKEVLQGADLPALKSLLSDLVEMEAPTLSAYEPVPNIPAFDGVLNLPFNGMPGNSVLTTLSTVNGGVSGLTMPQTPGTLTVKIEEEGMVPVDLALTTDPDEIFVFGTQLGQLRTLVRDLLKSVMWYFVLNHIWGVLFKL